ncbi:MAG: hypothetical protein GVY12_13015 [Bacteroidetes bacterium]|jgi:hypothetical protein|nr:hypothetical protein [Bacteroidota bacterium]
MQSVIIQLSALSGLLVFLQMAWTQAPLEVALLQGAGTGLIVYLVAVVGLTLVRHILTYTPEPEEEAPKEEVEIEEPSSSNAASPNATSPNRSAKAGDAAARTAQRTPAPAARETAAAS